MDTLPLNIFEKWVEAPVKVVGESPEIHPTSGPLYTILTKFRQMWLATSINFETDTPTFEKFPENVKEALLKLMVFFIRSENGISENLNSFNEFNSKIITSILTAQDNMENIHAETYARQLEALLVIEGERNSIINRYKDLDGIIQKKMDFMKKYMDKDLLSKTFGMVLAEGILFQTSFAIIHLINAKASTIGRLNGVITANDYISRDEGLHSELFAYLFRCLKKSFTGIDTNNYSEMIEDAKNVEFEYIKFVMNNEDLLGYTINDFKVYIDYIGGWIEELVFGIKNVKTHPLDFMINYNSMKRVIQFEVESVNYISTSNAVTISSLKRRQDEFNDRSNLILKQIKGE